MLVSLDEAKQYLRVDSKDEDDLITSLIGSSEDIAKDVARITTDQWKAVDSSENLDETVYNADEVEAVRKVLKVAVLYTLGYLYEHREEADHHDLALTLRALLFGIREAKF